MTAQDYILTKLEELKKPLNISLPQDIDGLIEVIFKYVMSKKFRKYAANEDLRVHIRNAIKINVEKNEPINITFLHGAYKLWRFEEAPEADWAELFSLMHYSNWVKPICEIYKPGVWFDFFVDDLIITRMNNIPKEDVDVYISSYQNVINFLTNYQPRNLKMTVTPLCGQFASEEEFDESLQRNYAKIAEGDFGGLPTLGDSQKATIELNVKLTEKQLQDPKWREKVFHLFKAYLLTKTELGYHKGHPEKILAFTQPLASGTAISVGSTRSSVVKFWVGVGVLRPKDDGYSQIILSPNQLENVKFIVESVSIKGLKGKNFNSIRVIENV